MITVVVIVGVISAVAYPKFTDWKKKEKLEMLL
jgi:Tfp pilus assembly protein PilE